MRTMQYGEMTFFVDIFAYVSTYVLIVLDK